MASVGFDFSVYIYECEFIKHIAYEVNDISWNCKIVKFPQSICLDIKS